MTPFGALVLHSPLHSDLHFRRTATTHGRQARYLSSQWPAMDTCCQLDSLAEELGDLSLDPALEDCCRRDLEQQAASARLRSALLSRDCTTLPSKLRSQAVALQALPAGALEAYQTQQRSQQASLRVEASCSSSLESDDDLHDSAGTITQHANSIAISHHGHW